MMDINVDLLQWFMNGGTASGRTVKNEIMSNKELAGMQLISKFDKGFRFLLRLYRYL